MEIKVSEIKQIAGNNFKSWRKPTLAETYRNACTHVGISQEFCEKVIAAMRERTSQVHHDGKAINVAAFAFYHDKGIEGYKIPITRKFFDTVISKDIQE